MKGLKKWIGLFLVVFIAVGVSSCGQSNNNSTGKNPSNDKEECEHTYSSRWEWNDTHHFHRATCEHKDLIKDNEPHKFGKWVLLENGKEEERKCEVCEYIESRLVSHTCSYGDWQVKKNPSLKEEGLLQRVCLQNSSHIDEVTLPKLDQTHYIYEVKKPSTCSIKGEATYTFIIDEEKFPFSVELEIDASNHEYGQWKMVKKPTKNDVGELQRICDRNKEHIDTFELPILNETDYTYSKVPAGCLENGKETFIYKKDKQDFEIELIIKANGHASMMMHDAYKHWVETTCEHFSITDIENHTFIDGICTKCKAEETSVDESILYELNETEDGYIAVVNPNYEGTTLTVLETYQDLPVVEFKASIEETAFDGKNIKMLTLPASIRQIGKAAFNGYTNLIAVFYEGTIADWCKIAFETSESNPMRFAETFYLKEGTSYKEVTTISIPEEILGIRKYQFYGFRHITDFTLPSTLESIEEEAFAYCNGMEEFIVPNNVFFIGKDALVGTNLKRVTLPLLGGNGSTSYITSSYIGYYFGVHTRGFDTGWYHQDKLNDLEELTLTKITTLGEFALANLPNLKKLSLPNSLKELETNTVFYNCPKLEYTEYQNGYYLGNEENPYVLLTEMIDKEATNFEFSLQTRLIYASAFENAKITSIELPTTLIEIGQRAFYGSSLTSILIPAGITVLKGNIFSNCSSLEEVILPADLINISSTAFSNTNIKKATLNLEATFILGTAVEELNLIAGEGAITLKDYPNLKKINLKEGISDLGSDVLASCPNLEYTIKDNIKYLGNLDNPYLWLMHGIDKSVTELNISNETLYIYEQAFKDCTELDVVSIPYRILKIEKEAFSGCSKISFILFSSNPNIEIIEDYAFMNCTSLISLSLPDHLTYIGKNIINGCVSIKSLTLPFVGSTPNPTRASQYTLFGWIFGSTYDKGFTDIEQKYDSSSTKLRYSLPNSLEEIKITGGKLMYGAFSDIVTQNKIKKFTITKDVEIAKEISKPSSTSAMNYGKNCIVLSNLEYLSCPPEYVDYFKFTNVVELVVTSGNEKNLNLRGSDFYILSQFKKVTIKEGVEVIHITPNPLRYLTSLTLPNSLKVIYEDAFSGCEQLESVILPKGIVSLGNSLKDSNALGVSPFAASTILYYLGTEEEWNQITKAEITSFVYFYSEVQIANGWHYIDDVPTLW